MALLPPTFGEAPSSADAPPVTLQKPGSSSSQTVGASSSFSSPSRAPAAPVAPLGEAGRQVHALERGQLTERLARANLVHLHRALPRRLAARVQALQCEEGIRTVAAAQRRGDSRNVIDRVKLFQLLLDDRVQRRAQWSVEGGNRCIFSVNTDYKTCEEAQSTNEQIARPAA